MSSYFFYFVTILLLAVFSVSRVHQCEHKAVILFMMNFLCCGEIQKQVFLITYSCKISRAGGYKVTKLSRNQPSSFAVILLEIKTVCVWENGYTRWLRENRKKCRCRENRCIGLPIKAKNDTLRYFWGSSVQQVTRWSAVSEREGEDKWWSKKHRRPVEFFFS